MSVEVQHVPLELRHGRAIRAVMREVARIAAGVAKAPVLSMQSPVQLPPHDLSKPETDRTRPQTWSRSSAIAVRFALALPRATTALRLDVADAFAAFCRRTGVGLWLADSRSGYRTGNWFTICEHDTEKVLEAFDRSLNPKGVRRAHSCLPVTFVGPARRDAVSAILDYLDHYPELGVLGCSMATIDDIAFIHMQLAINALPGEELLPRVNAALDAMPLARAEPAALPEILSHLVTRAPREVDPNTKLRFAHRVGDHHLLVGPALPVTTDVDRGRGALWVSWEIDGSGAELRVPFLALQDALIDLGLLHPTNPTAHPSANVEYLICRKVRKSVLRGKGKLSLPTEVANDYGHRDLQRALSVLSERIENTWRAKLSRKNRVRELTVSWREYWLGHWTSPLD